MKKYLGTIGTVVVVGIICRGLIRKVARGVVNEELAILEEQETFNIERTNLSDIVYETRTVAEKVLDDMNDLIDNYGVVTVADMKTLSEIDTTYVDQYCGWTKLTTARVQRIRHGYVLDLPNPVKLS